MLIRVRAALSTPGPNDRAVPQGQSKYDVDKENEGEGRGGEGGGRGCFPI